MFTATGRAVIPALSWETNGGMQQFHSLLTVTEPLYAESFCVRTPGFDQARVNCERAAGRAPLLFHAANLSVPPIFHSFCLSGLCLPLSADFSTPFPQSLMLWHSLPQLAISPPLVPSKPAVCSSLQGCLLHDLSENSVHVFPELLHVQVLRFLAQDSRILLRWHWFLYFSSRLPLFPLPLPFPHLLPSDPHPLHPWPYSLSFPFLYWPCCHVSTGSSLSSPCSPSLCWLKGKTVQSLAFAQTLTLWTVVGADLPVFRTRSPWTYGGCCWRTTGSRGFLQISLCSTATWSTWTFATTHFQTLSQGLLALPPGWFFWTSAATTLRRFPKGLLESLGA